MQLLYGAHVYMELMEDKHFQFNDFHGIVIDFIILLMKNLRQALNSTVLKASNERNFINQFINFMKRNKIKYNN